ncbi:MAG: DUF1428 domain-containing protein [Acidobacteria bacterium]|nr:MAG: DUF1428 domain-containing protein [Acidobacteriota bacterium]REK04221.1 MAG: DUF1428 domain-containing protein [Acidobacteriota bacterium]REK15482.1 MAG: DUF1428 domain-containing protein [Acidobacteriota bacterium]REK46473.1 MAG: DUF1428 domain-containing protein [Acidobacteriota bacterium]
MAFGGFRTIVESYGKQARSGSAGKYVDGFVLPLKKGNVDSYQKMSEKASTVWMEHGALEYVECAGDDLNSEHTTSFPEMAGAGEEETVIFAYIVYASKEDRDRANAAIMEDERIKEMMKDEDHPFDPSRMAYGGFRTIVEAFKN